MYLLMIFVLGSSAGALGNILFQLINRYIPGPDVSYYGSAYVGNALKFPVATLVIMFPVLIWVIWFLNRDMTVHPEKRDLRIRKWLLYLTLFVAGLTILGDLVALVLGLLDGNTALRFILEVLVVFWLAGSIFFYFLKDLHNQAPVARRIVGWVTIVVAVAALAASLMLIGTPASQRARNNDDLRVNNLQMLESQVIMYWQAKGTLPPTLSALADGTISGSVPPPTDPTTQAPYEYRVTGSKSYEFCAIFETESVSPGDIKTAPMPFNGNPSITTWSHPAGRQCFEGTIDPDRFPPLKR